jgi:hypothetical protein
MNVHVDCPDHGDQTVTGISGDLRSVSLSCGCVLIDGHYEGDRP